MTHNNPHMFKIRTVEDEYGYSKTGKLFYIVSWPDRGDVREISSMNAIWNHAFETGEHQVGFANATNCLWVDSIVYLQSTDDGYSVYLLLKQLGSIDQVVFHTHEFATDFIYRMEKHITFRLLSRIYNENPS